MKELAFIRPAPIYIEIGPESLRALRADDGIEVPLERAAGGRLTDSCRQKLNVALKAFLKPKAWQPRARAYCAISASGVSVRRLALPPASAEESHRLLLLQIESEFPLAPEQLAWGSFPLGTAQDGNRREHLVAAVKKESLEEYASLLAECGMAPVFTLAVLARASLCPQPPGEWAVLNVGSKFSECGVFDGAALGAVRMLPWGLGDGVSDEHLDRLADSLRSQISRRTIFLAGGGERQRLVSEHLAKRFGGGACIPIEVATAAGFSAATVGLKKRIAEQGGPLPLLLQIQPRPEEPKRHWNEPTLRKWATAAAVLLAALVVLPYAEAFLFKPLLTRKLTAIKSDEKRLPAIDQELNFLQFLKENQPPYLDALYLLAHAAPSGMRLDSLTMNRRGEVSLRGSMHNSQQVVEFRSALIKSGFFSDVSVEEQVPEPNHQKVTVRITAQWKPAAARALLSIGPTDEEIEKAKNRKRSPSPGAPPGFPMPGGMPVMLPPGAMPPGMIHH